MRARDITHRPDALTRLLLVGAAAGLMFLVFLGLPQAAHAQLVCPPPGHPEGCRPICEVDAQHPAATLTGTIAGPGSATLEAQAKNPYKGATDNANKGTDECATPVLAGPTDWSWTVKRWCGFHCEHWHTLVSPGTLGGGTPYPATAIVSVTNVEAGHYFLGWTTPGPCAPPSSPTLSRTDCSVFLNTEQSVEANLGDTQDGTAPTASTVSKGVVKRYSIQIKWTPSIDETWLGGYEILRNGIPYARRGPAATAFTATSLLCNTKYRWRVRAFDSVHLIDSNSIIVKTGACAKVPPNTVLHVKPPGVTRSRTAYFHWGAVRRGVDLIRFKSQCRLGRYGVWRKCFPGKTYRNLKPGYHTVRIRTGDSQGWDRTPVKYRWLVRR